MWMWELGYKESWAPKNWCFWTVVLEKILDSPLACKEIKLVNPKGNQAWIFIGRTDAEAKAPILQSPDGKRWLTGKDPDAGKDWRWEEKGTTLYRWKASTSPYLFYHLRCPYHGHPQQQGRVTFLTAEWALLMPLETPVWSRPRVGCLEEMDWIDNQLH